MQRGVITSSASVLHDDSVAPTHLERSVKLNITELQDIYSTLSQGKTNLAELQKLPAPAQ
jgi:hypothetical protein